PIARIAARPNTPVRRAPTERAATVGTSAWVSGAGAGTAAAGAAACCGLIAACTEFQVNRGSVNTSSAHTKVTANARIVRRSGITGWSPGRGSKRDAYEAKTQNGAACARGGQPLWMLQRCHGPPRQQATSAQEPPCAPR